jgi:hypothetical protein
MQGGLVSEQRSDRQLVPEPSIEGLRWHELPKQDG